MFLAILAIGFGILGTLIIESIDRKSGDFGGIKVFTGGQA